MVVEQFASLPDPELIDACLKGQSQAWEAIIVRYQRLIYSIPLRYGLPEHDANDIFQNVSLLLLENLDRLRNRQRLGAWLVVTTRRECWRVMRQKRANASLSGPSILDEQASESLQSEENFLLLERQSIVRSAVDHLGSPCKELLEMLFYQEPKPSYTEVAHRLSIAEGSIGPTRARCLEKLMRILERMGFSEL